MSVCGLDEINSDRWKWVFFVTIQIISIVTKKMWSCGSGIERRKRQSVSNGSLEKW